MYNSMCYVSLYTSGDKPPSGSSVDIIQVIGSQVRIEDSESKRETKVNISGDK